MLISLCSMLYSLHTIGLSVVDIFMESVSATDTAVFVVSFIFVLINVKDDIKVKGE